jgi:CelD/BcsL family acetyltransferase involved in cellulose biosynthesis
MKFSVIAPHELGRDDCFTWLSVVRGNVALASPYFRPEFTTAVGRARSDARVCVLEDGARVVGYFPFQRGSLGGGRPIGGPLSDYQAVIAANDDSFDVDELLKGSGLAYWEFDHLIASQAPFRKHHRTHAASPFIDLSNSFEAYLAARRRSGSALFVQLERKARKLTREVGTVTLLTDCFDANVLGKVFTWKSNQCLRTGAPDYFAFSWTRELVERIFATRERHFSGMLSALYAGDRLVAAQMGMRSERVLHWWFPVYDRDFARYSPGAILLLRLAQSAGTLGVAGIDLGKGADPYKASFASGAIQLAVGRAARRSLSAALRQLRDNSENALRDSSWVAPIRPLLRRFNARLRQRTYA